MLVAATVLLSALRLALGDFSRWDLVAVAGLFAFQPFAEWLIHVFVLHHRPRQVLGMNIDFHAAWAHRRHHADPWNLRYVVMPVPVLLIATATQSLFFWLVMPTWALFTTLTWMSAVMALHYEWVHFLVHTSYVPKTRAYRKMWKLHRLHHFKNEHYWFGVTRHFGDVVLRTMPDQSTVPTSETARALQQ
jgi:hypothetical protein